MAAFIEELWNSIFTPGTTPTLLVATNASFAALQFLFLILLLATHSIHFVVLTILCAGLWFAINWFVRELQIEKAKAATQAPQNKREQSPEPGSDTETEMDPQQTSSRQSEPPQAAPAANLLRPKPYEENGGVRRRRSLGDSSGYVSTDSEWEKVSEGGSR